MIEDELRRRSVRDVEQTSALPMAKRPTVGALAIVVIVIVLVMAFMLIS